MDLRGFYFLSSLSAVPSMAPPSPSSSTSSPSLLLNFASLPITAMREKIVKKIMDNHVTLIVGETGCVALLPQIVGRMRSDVPVMEDSIERPLASKGENPIDVVEPFSTSDTTPFSDPHTTRMSIIND